MKKLIALIGGMAGAATTTVLHEALKIAAPSVAPRMDLLDMEIINRVRERVHLSSLSEETLFKPTLIAEMALYTVYYSFAGGNAADLKGTSLGIAAGLSAIQLPEKLGLDTSHSRRTKTTEYLTMGIYIAGGLIAAATIGGLTQLSDTVGNKVKKTERRVKNTKLPSVSTKKIRRKLHI